MVTCRIKGCHKQAKIFKKHLGFCDEHWSIIGSAGYLPKEDSVRGVNVMGKDIRKKIRENEYVLAWVPAEDTTLGDAHYIDTKDYQIPAPEEIRELVRQIFHTGGIE